LRVLASLELRKVGIRVEQHVDELRHGSDVARWLLEATEYLCDAKGGGTGERDNKSGGDNSELRREETSPPE
jgi:hypothetical protein